MTSTVGLFLPFFLRLLRLQPDLFSLWSFHETTVCVAALTLVKIYISYILHKKLGCVEISDAIEEGLFYCKQLFMYREHQPGHWQY